MKKLELIILALILVGVIIGDVILYKSYVYMGYAKDSLAHEMYADTKEITSWLESIYTIEGDIYVNMD